MSPSDPELSIVIPVYNESGNVEPLCSRLIPVLGRITPDWEIVFVDDGSQDDTIAAIRFRTARDARIRAVAFSRAFGKAAGLGAAVD